MNHILVCTVVLVACSLSRVKGQTYDYVLLPGSTITPANGVTVTGPSEALTGTFSWTADPANSNSTISAYFVTSLDFDSSGYTITDTSGGSTDETQTGGGASFNAPTNITGDLSGSFEIDTITAGSFEGSPLDPTGLTFDDLGVAPLGGGLFVAHASINAQLVPEPSQTAMLLLGLGLLAFWRVRMHRKA